MLFMNPVMQMWIFHYSWSRHDFLLEWAVGGFVLLIRAFGEWLSVLAIQIGRHRRRVAALVERLVVGETS
jgi:hypothetical protein